MRILAFAAAAANSRVRATESRPTRYPSMKLQISVLLDYRLLEPAHLMLQVEAAALPGEQQVARTRFDAGTPEHFARIAAPDGIGERIWLRCAGRLQARYSATIEVRRVERALEPLAQVPLHRLPPDAVQYLNESRYCPSNRLVPFAKAEFGGVEGGAKIAAMRDWIARHFTYDAGASIAETTAIDSFVERRGVCRDYAHVLVALARAADFPARVVSGYAPRVEPQDFHAVAEVFVGGDWHLVDPTGMAGAAELVKVAAGRDAADISFLTAYGEAELIEQRVMVKALER
jgi:transglutaminase-like putative cysteine protease